MKPGVIIIITIKIHMKLLGRNRTISEKCVREEGGGGVRSTYSGAGEGKEDLVKIKKNTKKTVYLKSYG